jgi:hypothetical protein
MDYDSYEDDALDPERWGGWTGPGGYGTICREGKAVCVLGDDAAGPTVDVPEDGDDITNEQFAEMMKGTNSRIVNSKNKSEFNLTYTAGKVNFNIQKPSQVRFALYDLSGRLARTISDTHMEAGSHTLSIDNSKLPAGAYMLSMQTPTAKQTRRILTTGN